MSQGETPLRVCMFVINGVSVDTRVMKEASTLAAAGHEVIVLGVRDEGQAAVEALEGFTVRRLRRDPVTRRAGARAPGTLSRAMRPLFLLAGLADYAIRAVWAGARLRAGVHHAHDLSTLPLAWAASRLGGGRLVYDAHELFTEIGRLPAWVRAPLRLVEGVLIRRADAVITVNGSIAGELARRYGVGRPVVVMNCPRTEGVLSAAPPGDAPLRRAAGVPGGAPLVLFQGMFMAHRGLENLVRAARLFRRAHLVFMGWGPLRPVLETLAAEQGIADRVRVLDGVPLRDLLAWTSGADLGAIPYRNVGLNNYFTSPNKLFEYLAAGVPVVASRFPELVRVIESHGCGRTFDPEDPEDIAAAVNGLLDDPPALARAREGALAAGRRYTWENESRTLLDVYARVAAGGPLPG